MRSGAVSYTHLDVYKRQSKADMIVSLAGRDKGQLFFVVDTDEQYVYLSLLHI